MSIDLLLVKSTTSNIVEMLLVGCIIAIFYVDLSVSYSMCYGDQYAKNSTFQANLNTLLSTMKDYSLSTKFYNGSVGEEGSLDRVYGLFFCTADLPQIDCPNCILQATNEVLQNCSTDKEGIILDNSCGLHYSNQSFFGDIDTRGIIYYNVNQYPSGTTDHLTLMTMLVEEAPFQQSVMFASSVDKINDRYGMAQCTNDLSSSACQSCLLIILGETTSCCSNHTGWYTVKTSCQIRYETYPFLKNMNASTQTTMTHVCSNDDFPSGKESKLNANLNRLLSSLLTNGSKTGFYNTSIGTNSTTEDVVHGLVLCRGDINSTTCEDCLDMSIKNISQYCPNKTNGIVWHENCLLRYSDQDFFSLVDYDGRTDCNQEVTTEDDADVAIVGLMTGLIKVATDQQEQSLMYAAGNVSINSNLSIYGQLQCTRDLSSDSCKNCLNFGLTNVSSNCKLRNGWRYLSGSCILRYEDFLFFDPTISARLSSPSSIARKHSDHLIIEIIASINGVFLACLVFYIWRKRSRNAQRNQFIVTNAPSDESFRWMDINTIRRATNNFSQINKLGEGGFGPVYKGTLPNGNDIAIKRLSNASTQGSQEFKNEVELIWKLQHRNLVKLLGSCSDGDEKLLVYEYLPNGSLDNFIFNREKRSLWNWKIFTDIIFGIARGLVYLHEDSQLKVIHRDMKPSNILLDNKMNPKISDFGMARIFNGETEVKTHRVVGTHGYLAPEYAMTGVFSAKSDVFSFGVILLEIICGRKNSSSYFMEKGHSLLSQAWGLWREGRGSEFIDSMIMDHQLFPVNEIMRFYNIGLLCVQENTTDRPSMSMVLLMLKSEQMLLPQPKRPPSIFMHDDGSTAQNQSHVLNNSANELTISNEDGR